MTATTSMFLGIFAITLYAILQLLKFYGVGQDIYFPYLFFSLLLVGAWLILPAKNDV
jgi:hypothetical protein